jgi:hypothetical protein
VSRIQPWARQPRWIAGGSHFELATTISSSPQMHCGTVRQKRKGGFNSRRASEWAHFDDACDACHSVGDVPNERIYGAVFHCRKPTLKAVRQANNSVCGKHAVSIASPCAVGGTHCVPTHRNHWIMCRCRYILPGPVRDGVLDIMAAQGQAKAAGFVGPFDAVMRSGPSPEMDAAIDALISDAADRGIYMRSVEGSPLCRALPLKTPSMSNHEANAARISCNPFMCPHTSAGCVEVARAQNQK